MHYIGVCMNETEMNFSFARGEVSDQRYPQIPLLIDTQRRICVGDFLQDELMWTMVSGSCKSAIQL